MKLYAVPLSTRASATGGSAVPDCGLMLEPPGSASKENVHCEGGQTSIGR
jgi:hypothetical protein